VIDPGRGDHPDGPDRVMLQRVLGTPIDQLTQRSARRQANDDENRLFNPSDPHELLRQDRRALWVVRRVP
jgi:hypothetical protein